MAQSKRPVLTFRAESVDEAQAVRKLADRRYDGNLSRLIREALRSEHPELRKLAPNGRRTS